MLKDITIYIYIRNFFLKKNIKFTFLKKRNASFGLISGKAKQ